MFSSFLFCFIVLCSFSVEAAIIRRVIPRALASKRCFSVKKDLLVIPVCKGSACDKFNIYLSDKEVVKRLVRGPLPLHLLLDPEYFTDVVKRGKHSLCSHLLRNGQKVELIDKDGNNLLVRIIEKKMSYLIGILMETNHDMTMLALYIKDAATGHTPLSMAIEQGDRIAVLEIVSPRPQLKL